MTVTIQKTSKNIKAHMVCAAFVMVLGFFFLSGEGENSPHFGGLFISFGTFWFLGAKIARWWHHD